MIEVKNLTKKYGEKLAVDHLSFEVNDGDVLGFLGPNGAGKSTTMNMLTGYLSATEGSVVVEGISMQENPEEAKRKIGYLPEIPPLYTDLTVMEYLRFAMRLKKVKGIRDAENYLTGICQRTGIEQVRGRLIRHLSKGYRQRVGFAQAILGYPEIIILDEPTVGLDPKQIIEIRELIRHLGEKHTVILSSHILPEISAVCDHVFIISKGKLVASDSTENLVNLMSGAQEIELTVRTGAGEAAGYLQGEENIARVEQADHDKIRIYAKKGADVREEVFRQMAEHNVLVLEMKTVTKSLEDVFLEITQEGGAQ